MSCTCSFDNICFDIQVNTHEKVMGNLLCEVRYCSLYMAKSSLFNCDQVFGLNLVYFMMGTMQGANGSSGDNDQQLYKLYWVMHVHSFSTRRM